LGAMGTNGETLEHVFDEDNVILVEEEPKDLTIHVNKHDFTVSNVTRQRSIVWHEYLAIPASEFEHGMKQATCKHCENETFIADSRYGTKNTKKHLERCLAYQAVKEA